MQPIPTEMRKRILNDLNKGMTWTTAAEKWKVSPSFIAKLQRQVRETGNIDPIKPKTGPKPKLEPYRDRLND
jgi:transposase